MTPELRLGQALNRLGELLRAAANDQLSVIERERRAITKSTPNTWQKPLASALLAERAHVMALRAEVAAIHPPPPGSADALGAMDAAAAGLLDLVAALTTSDSMSAARFASASQSAFLKAETAASAAARSVG